MPNLDESPSYGPSIPTISKELADRQYRDHLRSLAAAARAESLVVPNPRLHPRLQWATYEDAKRLYMERQVTRQDILDWFPAWCVGKTEHRWNNEVAEERLSPRLHDDDGPWIPISWIMQPDVQGTL